MLGPEQKQEEEEEEEEKREGKGEGDGERREGTTSEEDNAATVTFGVVFYEEGGGISGRF